MAVIMAVVAQLVEPRVVISVVVGSSPINRPNILDVSLIKKYTVLDRRLFFAQISSSSRS